ncbi:hypothetical protein PV08_05449 [Exophiala spinifera]|uniref:VOC domain-containing protein n=1 Tax=Exophiala spinifera TaxID=91928 RepID=A0A0D2B921_9EURO|nr:uncharacterized protein PV08_05449 [Exophiala spinifera]KIW15403.1 hypothetical protein PV08_05449 [Exophiala spinifera]
MSLVHHLCLPCPASKLEAEVAFFSNACAHMGVKEVMRPVPTVVGLGETAPWLWISGVDGKREPIADTEQIHPVHLALAAKDQAQVDAFYEAALKAGGKDNGAPGLRPEYRSNYYGAFVISPAGHNIEAVIFLPE